MSAKKLNLALLCGGPSRERGISLNSARSIMDHLTCDEINIHAFYVDHDLNFYAISTSQLYSNTPSDFDFKLLRTATKLTQPNLIERLKNLDIVFPVIHGAFGEDGQLQAFLEMHNIPYIGSDSSACKKMFHKYNAANILAQYQYPTLASKLLKKNDPDNNTIIREFFNTHLLQRAVIKPVAGGSSIGVFSAETAEEAIEKCQRLFYMNIDNEALIEPFCNGKEFTIIVLQNPNNKPVALIPSEIQVSYENGNIFDYRRKYLPTSNTKWPCPPHFDDTLIKDIQAQAEDIFIKFGMRDFARLDGWILEGNKIYFTDLNPISGMEQNSFIFQQSSRIGLTHKDLLWNILTTACQRYGIPAPDKKNPEVITQKNIHILFGGSTAERQISLMSGTNVWLKLNESQKYKAHPYYLDQHGHVWSIPYTYALNHTVEEIYDNCLTSNATITRLEDLTYKIHQRLAFAPVSYDVRKNISKKYSFEQFLNLSKDQDAFIFLGLHGGEGENGCIQQRLDEAGLIYNGSGPEASELCMDKYYTGEAILKIGDPDIITAPKKQIKISQFIHFSDNDYNNFWKKLQKELGSITFVIKPQNDGCSAGIIHLNKPNDFKKYVQLVLSHAAYIEENTFENQSSVIEMARDPNADYIIEAFIETDQICIEKNNLIHEIKTGWIEFTAGVLEHRGIYHSLNPSITIAESKVLSLEEKFQGGTGINITPPPEHIVSPNQLEKLKTSIEKISKALGILNYARLDVFFNIKTNKTLLIEANTLPGLTGSTVIFHQALAESTPMNPREFLEKIIESKIGLD
ncbi:hypothetical protein ACFL96_15425 [Thermoproteota archaeon]